MTKAAGHDTSSFLNLGLSGHVNSKKMKVLYFNSSCLTLTATQPSYYELNMIE